MEYNNGSEFSLDLDLDPYGDGYTEAGATMESLESLRATHNSKKRKADEMDEPWVVPYGAWGSVS